MKGSFILLVVVLFLLEIITSIKLKLSPKQISNDMMLNTTSPLFSNVSFIIPTITLCIGKPNKECLSLGINSIASFTLIKKHRNNEKQIGLLYPSKSVSYHEEMTLNGFRIRFPDKDLYGITGNVANDYIYLNKADKNSGCNKEYKFLHIDNFEIDLDGFIGIQKTSSKTNIFYKEHLFFVNYFAKAKLIENEAITIRYTSNGKGSIVLGQRLEGFDTCESNNKWWFWDCNLSTVKIGDKELMVSGVTIEFHSMGNYIIGPNYLGGTMIQDEIIALSNGKCIKENEENFSLIICNKNLQYDDFPNISFYMNNTILNVKWKNLFKTVIDNNREMFISLFIVNLTDFDTQWSIGIPGFIDNEILFDYPTKTIGIRINKTEDKDEEEGSLQKIIYLLTSIITSIGIVIIFAYKIR